MLILIQYTDSLTWRCVFLMPMRLLCNCPGTCLCNREGIIICLPFITMPSIRTSTYHIGQHFSASGSNASLVCGHPLMIYFLSICNLASSSVATFMCSIDVHMDTSTDVLMGCILTFIKLFLGHGSQCGCGMMANLHNSSGSTFMRYTHTVLVYTQHDALKMLR